MWQFFFHICSEISETNIHTCIVSGYLSTWLFFRGHLGLAVWCGVSHCVEDRVATSRCLFLVSSVRRWNGVSLTFIPYPFFFICTCSNVYCRKAYLPIKSVLNNEYAGNVPFQQLLQTLSIHGYCICSDISFLCDTCHMALKHFLHIHNR